MFVKKLFFLFILISFTYLFYSKVFHLAVGSQQPTEKVPCIFYSNHCQSDLRWTLFSALKNAKKSIHVMIFGLTEPSLIHILSEKSKQIPVTVYYDKRASKALEKTFESVTTHVIQKGGLFHQKILIIDEKLVFMGSANFTQSSLSMHDNLMIGLHHKKLAKYLIEKAPLASGHSTFFLEGQEINLWLLPDPRATALNAMLKLLRKAKKNIRVAIFTFTHPALVEELTLAKKRGVDVTVIADQTSQIGPCSKVVKELVKANISVRLSQNTKLLHHKFIYVDDKSLLTGSANFTKAAFYKNHDNFLIFHNLKEPQKNFMDKLWQALVSESRNFKSS